MSQVDKAARGWLWERDLLKLLQAEIFFIFVETVHLCALFWHGLCQLGWNTDTERTFDQLYY